MTKNWTREEALRTAFDDLSNIKACQIFSEPLSEHYLFLFAKDSDFQKTKTLYKKWFVNFSALPETPEEFENIARILREHPKAEVYYGRDDDMSLEEWEERDMTEEELVEQEATYSRFKKWKKDNPSNDTIRWSRLEFNCNPPMMEGYFTVEKEEDE